MRAEFNTHNAEILVAQLFSLEQRRIRYTGWRRGGGRGSKLLNFLEGKGVGFTYSR